MNIQEVIEVSFSLQQISNWLLSFSCAEITLESYVFTCRDLYLVLC